MSILRKSHGLLAAVLVCFAWFYTESFEKQIFAENNRNVSSLASRVYAFTNTAYRVVEELCFNRDMLSMETALQDMILSSSETGSWAFILDGKGIVIAHPESRYLEELCNYKTMTRTVSVKDGAGNIRRNGEGNILTTEEAFPISAEYREAVSDMMTGGGGSAKIRDGGETLYLSYMPVKLDGASLPPSGTRPSLWRRWETSFRK